MHKHTVAVIGLQPYHLRCCQGIILDYVGDVISHACSLSTDDARSGFTKPLGTQTCAWGHIRVRNMGSGLYGLYSLQ